MELQERAKRRGRRPHLAPEQKRIKVCRWRANAEDLARLQQLADDRAENGSKVVRAGIAELKEGAREVEQLRQIAANIVDPAARRDLQRIIDEKAERVGHRRPAEFAR